MKHANSPPNKRERAIDVLVKSFKSSNLRSRHAAVGIQRLSANVAGFLAGQEITRQGYSEYESNISIIALCYRYE
ncbi:hypothetical protein J7E73_14725 [Paenibacillus albidus]|uniref:hypothetical protein n=1 Tax=Paenibacillus albidus TaxID=2041023 RepID=UPI001BE5D5DC|nr:hypothetical protein [Paenibacillus albidus]MBT2290373.1 hypothetical protein [Paenibacillus albidus]